MDPTDEVKAVLGWVMHNVMLLTKSLDKTIPRYPGDERFKIGSFSIGLEPDELTDRVNRAIATFK